MGLWAPEEQRAMAEEEEVQEGNMSKCDLYFDLCVDNNLGHAHTLPVAQPYTNTQYAS